MNTITMKRIRSLYGVRSLLSREDIPDIIFLSSSQTDEDLLSDLELRSLRLLRDMAVKLRRIVSKCLFTNLLEI